MKTKSPASGRRQGLDDDSQNFQSGTIPTESTNSRSRHKLLEQIAQRWANRGYYPTPTTAMEALTEGYHEYM